MTVVLYQGAGVDEDSGTARVAGEAGVMQRRHVVVRGLVDAMAGGEQAAQQRLFPTVRRPVNRKLLHCDVMKRSVRQRHERQN